MYPVTGVLLRHAASGGGAGPATRRLSFNGARGRRSRPVRAQIRRVIEMSSGTTGKHPETFRYSSNCPMENLLKNPRFSKGTREL